MATTGKFDGKNLFVYVDGTAIAHSDACTLNITQGTFTTTTKDSSNWEDILTTVRGYTVDCSGAVTIVKDTGNAKVLTDLIINASLVSLRFSTGVTGDTDEHWSGVGYCTSLSVDASLGAAVSFSASFQGTGALVISPVT